MFRKWFPVSLPFFIFCFGSICADECCDQRQKLVVRGEAILSKPADELRVHLGVVSQGATAKEALSGNNEIMKQIIQSLTLLGIDQSEYETGRFLIRPVYSRRPQQAPVDWKPEIIGYEVTNRLMVKTNKMTLAGEMIDRATRAGANSVDSLQFTLKDARAYRDEAIKVAAENALTDAKALASASGVEIKKILSIVLDDPSGVSPLPRPMYAKTLAAEGVPIESGDVDVRASVSVEYEIESDF